MRTLLALALAGIALAMVTPSADALPRFRITIRPIEVAGETSSAATTLQRIRSATARLRLRQCLSGSATSLLKSTAGSSYDAGEVTLGEDAVSGMAIDCLSRSASSYLPSRGKQLVGSAIASQVMSAAAGADLSSSGEIPVSIDLNDVGSEDPYVSSPGYGYSSGGDETPWPLIAAGGGLVLVLLLGGMLIRRR